MIEKIDHMGIIVDNLDEALKLYRDLLGLKVEKIEYDEKTKLKMAFLRVGETSLELIEAEDPSITKKVLSLDLSKEGFHHIALKVKDIDGMLNKLKKSGVKLIHEEPYGGARGARVSFINPKSTMKTMLELVERKE